MDLYKLPQLQKEYFAQAQRELQPSYPARPRSYLSYSSPHAPFSYTDLSLLREFLTFQEPEYASLADQVFGSQARRERLFLQQLTQLLYERALIHEKHLKDISHRHMGCQERLSIVRMLTTDPESRGQANLERLLIQLESETRGEELSFWKDTASLRKEILEEAAEYRAARDRWLHLGSLEVNYG